MKLDMFSVYDSRAEAFITPFFLPNIGTALRAISSAGTDSKHMFCRHGSDFVLYHLGQFDDASSEILQMLPPKHLGIVSDICKEYPQEVLQGELNA